MAVLPGVKVGPLDPDSTSQFGTVSQSNSARTLIRLHTQMNPPALRVALSKPRDDERTAGLDMDEVREYLGGLTRDNDDPLVPEGAEVTAAAVRGDRLGQQILTFGYQLPSGRVGKWHAPYNAEVLPTSYQQGSELAQIKQMKDRGVVAWDTDGTQVEIQRRELGERQREIRALREQLEGGGRADDARTDGSDETPDTRGQLERDDEMLQLRAANREMREELIALRAMTGQGAGQVPTGGVEQDFEGSPANQSAGADEQQPQVAAQDPPFEGYDEMRAQQVAEHLRSEDRTDEERQAILDYERTHANRRSVVLAGEQSLSGGR